MNMTSQQKAELETFAQAHGLTLEEATGEVLMAETEFHSSEEIIPEGFNPECISMYLYKAKTIPASFNPNVFDITMNALEEIPADWNPTKAKHICLLAVREVPEGWNPQLNALHLENARKLPANWSPVIADTLDITNVETLPEGFNPNVAGDLYVNPAVKFEDEFYGKMNGRIFFCDEETGQLRRY